MLLLFLSALLSSPSCALSGDAAVFRFARYYGDHMVLPASPQKAVIWGYGEAGQLVHILYQGTPYLTSVDRVTGGQASWQFVLPSNNAGGPYSIVLSSRAGGKLYALMLKDILFGDVWLCGGQSNMQFTVGQALSAAEEFNISSSYPNVRLLTVERKTSQVPLYDLPEGGIEEPWTSPSKSALFRPTWDHFSAVCWMFGRKLFDKFKRPIGLVSSNWGGTPIEAWSSPDVLKKCGVEETSVNFTRRGLDELHGPQEPMILWNSMIHPLLRSNLFGVIWYQGEDNAFKPDQYHCLFPALIADWREKWHQGTEALSDPQFPFGFVQLAPNGTDRSLIGGFPVIRFAQTALFGRVPNTAMPKTFMSVAMDLPDLSSPYGTIHPRDKSDVAHRLFLGALSVAYGEEVRWTGPLVGAVSIRHVADTMWEIRVNYIPESISAGGLDIKSEDGFEVLVRFGPHYSVWKPVRTFSHAKDFLIFPWSMPTDAEIAAVRYGWRAYPCLFKACAVYEKDTQLPSPPWIVEMRFCNDKDKNSLETSSNYLYL